MLERLQKVIAEAGICSRRHAEELIISNKVKVNGEIINILGSKVSEEDVIEVDNVILNRENKVYYLLNKPSNVITTSSDTHKRKTILDCIDVKERVFAIGRLDYDTTGLIILTNDGDLDYKLAHPKFNISKTYIAYCKGRITKEKLKELEEGIILEDGPVKALSTKIISNDYFNTKVEIEVNVGKKHIIKRMVKYLGSTVLELHRSKIAFIQDDKLKIGEYRKLTSDEIRRLKEL